MHGRILSASASERQEGKLWKFMSVMSLTALEWLPETL